MRKQITLYDDQYNFFKTFKSTELLIAFVEYMFEDKEPTNLNDTEKVLFESLRVRMNNQKSKAKAGSIGGSNSKGGGRPKKQAENKQKTNTKQAKNKEDKDNISKDILLRESNKINNIDNKLSITEDKSSDNITGDINNLISELKELSNEMGIAYENKDERNFSKHILTAKSYGEFCSKINQTRSEFAKNIMKASVMIGYWKGPCSGPKAIYQNYVEVYNLSRKEQIKQQKNKIYSF